VGSGSGEWEWESGVGVGVGSGSGSGSGEWEVGVGVGFGSGGGKWRLGLPEGQEPTPRLAGFRYTAVAGPVAYTWWRSSNIGTFEDAPELKCQ